VKQASFFKKLQATKDEAASRLLKAQKAVEK
jgi:hypothetical protein